MSKGVNKVILIGHACADPESRNTPAGAMVVNVTIACNDSYKDKNTGAMVDSTEFVRVVFFGRLAEIVAEYMKKGSKAYIEGKLKTRSWETDGVKKYATEIVANEMQLLDSKPHPQESEARKPAPRQNNNGTQPSAALQPAPSAYDNFSDLEDIPF